MRWLAAFLLCITIATCGQKGPLRLPDQQALTTPPCRYAL